MKILALITARGGSKRLPQKNIKPLLGKPLIVWSIDAAKNIPEICDILVSTDDSFIADISKSAGAFVPWLRPENLATDAASSVDVALHALNWYEAESGPVDGLLLLQPTSPFRSRDYLCSGLKKYKESNYLPTIGVSESHTHPSWMLKMQGDYLMPFIEENKLEPRSQDLAPIYSINGSFYLISPGDLRRERSFVGKKIVPLFSELPYLAVDIDTAWDFKLAEMIAVLR